MDLNELDIIIFRKKTLVATLYSIVTLDLDNHVGIVIEINGEKYVSHYVISNIYNLISNIIFNTSHKCGKAILTPIEYIQNDEYYVYRTNTDLDTLVDTDTTDINIDTDQDISADTDQDISADTDLDTLVDTDTDQDSHVDTDTDTDQDISADTDQNTHIDQNKLENILFKSKHLNYVSNLSIIINFLLSRRLIPINITNTNINENHTCISYFLFILYELNLYDYSFINYDYYQKKIENIEGFKNKYELIYAHNVGKKDLTKINPYKIAYIISFAHNIVSFLCINIENKQGIIVPKYTMVLNVILVIIICMLNGYYANKLWNKNTEGRRYIGGIVIYFICCLFLFEYKLQIEKNYFFSISCFITCPRIFIIRFASWLCNDITGMINPTNKRPYDVALYEALFEGFIPSVFLWFAPLLSISYRAQNMIVITNYSISRFCIEFYKDSYLKPSILTLGQIDSILNFVLCYWFINFNLYEENISTINLYYYLFEYALIFLFYIDVCYRFSMNIFNSENKLGNILKLTWHTTYNNGFANGIFKDKSNIFKIVAPLIYLFTINKYLLYEYSNPSLQYIFNLFAGLNIFERLINGYVTDYLTIQVFSVRTLNLNFADIMINAMMIYFFITQSSFLLK